MLMLVLVALAAATDPPKAADPDNPRTMVAFRLVEDDGIRLDGMLAEAAWERAIPATDFLQQEPREGQPATERTEVRVLYDDQNLYIGALLYDSDPSGILGRELRRDAGLGADDRFMWVLDTFLDGRSGYFFEINPAGLMGDGLLSGSSVNKAWDGIWEARVARGEYGWSAEIRIPFRTLNFDPTSAAWGINFQRTVRRKSEESLWSGHLRNQGLSQIVHAGRLVGLSGISQGVGLEVKPYAVASWQHSPADGGPASETPMELGFDVTYSITPSLRASVTVNTDFAEAEVDQRRVNLTRFPLVFPERRDFFLEGSGVYAFAQSSGPTPYFSRRIGLVGGQPVPIAWGARLGGQAGAYDLGFLQVRTAGHEFGPTEDFTVARVKRGIFTQSTIGAIYTRRATHGFIDAPSHDGNTLGVDADFFTSRFRGNRNLQLEAFFVWHDAAPAAAGTSFGDRSARGLRLNYPNDILRAHVSAREFGDHYMPHVGFVSRRGFRRIQPTVSFQPRPSWSAVRQLEFTVAVEHLTDLRNRLETFGLDLTLFGILLETGDNAEIEVSSDFERIDNDFEIYPGVVIPAGDHEFRSWNVELRSASRRMVAGSLDVGGGQFWNGHRLWHQLGAELTPRPGLSVSANWERNEVDLPGGEFETNLLRAGAGWQFNPWTSLNASAQYDDVTRVVGLFSRFRWIVRPGSDIYLVYTHNLRERPFQLDPRGGFETLDRRATTKVTYTHRF